MKKNNLIWVCVIALFASLSLSSCSKDDEDVNLLLGAWLAEEYDNGVESYILFGEGNVGCIYCIMYGTSAYVNYKYIYDRDNNKLWLDNLEYEYYVTFDGNKMILENVNDRSRATFTRVAMTEDFRQALEKAAKAL